MTDEDILALVRETLQSHRHDRDAHRLPELERRQDQLERWLGRWTLVASDDFSGPDGPLGTTPIGNRSWSGVGGSQLHRVGGRCRSPDNALRGSVIETGAADGQVSAELVPGTGEASFYFRWQVHGSHLFLQRTAVTIGLFRFVGGPSQPVAAPALIGYQDGERIKVRFIGDRIWVLRSLGGTDTVVLDVTESAFLGSTRHGLRIGGNGSADRFEFLSREAL
jgi:hypothetical protein